MRWHGDDPPQRRNHQFINARLAGRQRSGLTAAMLWNDIRDRIRERLPAILDFILFAMVITIITAVLLGLTWLYVNYGMALFLVAAVLLWLANLFAGRRASVYIEGGPLMLGSDKLTLPPPSQRALHPPGTPQIGRANQALTKHRPALPKSSPK
jgi:hypothetical protein